MAQQQLITLITELLNKNPNTGADAITLYNDVTKLISNYLVNNLPTLEEKAIALEQLLEKKVEAEIVNCWGRKNNKKNK